MKEIGSFIELELEKGREYYNELSFGNENIIRLNTARAGIFHAVRCYGVDTVYLPVYQCDSVRDFLIKKGINIKYYNINEDFEPLIETNEDNSAIVFVNYYGVMSKRHFSFIARFKNVIIDNAQGFFFKPIKNCINVYSCRKFVGVPDGAYVIGNNVNRFEYELDYSSDTSLFLLSRIENGLQGKTYEIRKANEERLNTSDIKLMSKLTRNLLDSANYKRNIETRKSNFLYAAKLFNKINIINVNDLCDINTVPMVYPLLVNKDIIDDLHNDGIFQGHWWEYIPEEINKDCFEVKLAKYIIPITIDQRYDKKDIDYQYASVMKALGEE